MVARTRRPVQAVPSSTYGPGYRSASIAVIAAWLTYHAPNEQAEPGTFALVADEEHRFAAVSDGVKAS